MKKKILPIYIPSSKSKYCLAIWNCGMRPQTRWQALKDIRITIRKEGSPIFVIKKGAI
jgi:hypothetical protein